MGRDSGELGSPVKRSVVAGTVLVFRSIVCGTKELMLVGGITDWASSMMWLLVGSMVLRVGLWEVFSVGKREGVALVKATAPSSSGDVAFRVGIAVICAMVC